MKMLPIVSVVIKVLFTVHDNRKCALNIGQDINMTFPLSCTGLLSFIGTVFPMLPTRTDFSENHFFGDYFNISILTGWSLS